MAEEKIYRGKRLPDAVYLTSPDYLGRISPIEEIARVCREFGVLLLVDNAHGAYLKFLNPSRHPIDLGADMCCDSAHKTLPVLTGGAYLQISLRAPEIFRREAKRALAVFGSTSPSYLILASLDRANSRLGGEYREKLCAFAEKISAMKTQLCGMGYALFGDEPLKITVDAKKYGYYGDELATLLFAKDIVAEFADRDYLVLMPSPDNTDAELFKLALAFSKIPARAPIDEPAPRLCLPEKRLSIRDAMLSKSTDVSPAEAIGRVLAATSVGCPPAVPIAVSGEVIDRACAEAFIYYGAGTVSVIDGL